MITMEMIRTWEFLQGREEHLQYLQIDNCVFSSVSELW